MLILPWEIGYIIWRSGYIFTVLNSQLECWGVREYKRYKGLLRSWCSFSKFFSTCRWWVWHLNIIFCLWEVTFKYCTILISTCKFISSGSWSKACWDFLCPYQNAYYFLKFIANCILLTNKILQCTEVYQSSPSKWSTSWFPFPLTAKISADMYNLHSEYSCWITVQN